MSGLLVWPGRYRLGSHTRRLLAREQAAATWGQAVAGTAHTLAAYFHDRLRTVALDGETTITLPLVPAGRDARAAEGQGEPLRDVDPEWCAAHETAVERTQPIPPEAQQVAIAASGVDAMTDPNLPPDRSPGDWVNTTPDGWRPKPDPDGEDTQELATPGPDAIDTAEIRAVVVPYRDPANPAA